MQGYPVKQVSGGHFEQHFEDAVEFALLRGLLHEVSLLSNKAMLVGWDGKIVWCVIRELSKCSRHRGN